VSAPNPAEDLERLAGLAVDEFDTVLGANGWPALAPARLEIFQINLGRLCNQTCRHCHVDAGPDRVRENMDRRTLEQALALLDRLDVATVDVTGGAPELHPDFRWLVEECVRRGKHVIDRSNLTVLLLPKHADLGAWLGERGVEIVASLPHHRMRNTDAQRGEGVFERSIEALRGLNAVGYGRGDPRRRLTLVHNPAGAYLPGGQRSLEADWKASLARQFGITFDRLIALNNMPIGRYLDWLVESGNFEGYMARLAAAFNPAAVAGLMCRNTISIGWDGAIYDCDFNQMLELPSAPAKGRAHVADFVDAAFATRRIVTRRHCFGCTAGAGSSCGGATTAAKS
jgi:radical SAM/Cys-rich protein